MQNAPNSSSVPEWSFFVVFASALVAAYLVSRRLPKVEAVVPRGVRATAGCLGVPVAILCAVGGMQFATHGQTGPALALLFAGVFGFEYFGDVVMRIVRKDDRGAGG